jgi:uncharacterized membrane protein (UPF0127 family)
MLGSSKPMLAGVAFAIVIVASLILAAFQSRFKSGYVSIGDGLRVDVSVASNEPTRERGLSGRAGLGPNEGMYFVFQHADTFAFWMKEMRFPIDIIWINDGHIADITTDLPIPGPDGELPTFAPKVPVNRVLEVNAGYAKAHGLRIGLPVSEHL